MKNKKVPMRQCVGCRELRNKKDLMRILKTPDNNVIFDDTGRMNGRGAYICPSDGMFKKRPEEQKQLNARLIFPYRMKYMMR